MCRVTGNGIKLAKIHMGGWNEFLVQAVDNNGDLLERGGSTIKLKL